MNIIYKFIFFYGAKKHMISTVASLGSPNLLIVNITKFVTGPFGIGLMYKPK